MPLDPTSSTPSQEQPNSLATQGNASQTPTGTSSTPSQTPAALSLAVTGHDNEGGPPEGKYDLKIPDGMALDGKTSTEVDSLFRDAGLSNAKAQKFVDFYESKTKEAMEAPYQLWLDTQSEWVDK